MAFRTRDLLIRQRTQTLTALRAHLAEHGLIAPQGLSNLAGFQRLFEDSATGLNSLVVEAARMHIEQISDLSDRVAKMEATLKQGATRSDAPARMMTMPGLGPITTMAIETFAPSLSVLKRSRDFAAS